MTQHTTLSDLRKLDPEALVTLVLAQQEQLLSRDTEIEHLKRLIAKLRRLQFGRSSEKLKRQIDQLELKLEELQASQAENASVQVVVKEAVPPKTRVKTSIRRPLPEHLPREVRRYLPKQEACPDCGGKLEPLGEDVSEVLEYVPASLKVIRYVRPKLACGCCDRIVQAAAPSRPIERSIAGPGLFSPCTDIEILGSPAVVSSVGDLCTLGCGAGSLNPSRVGWWLEPVAGTAGGIVAASRAGGKEATCG